MYEYQSFSPEHEVQQNLDWKHTKVSTWIHSLINCFTSTPCHFSVCVSVPSACNTCVMAVCMENLAHWACLCVSALSPRCRRAGEVDPRLRGNYPPSHPPTPGMSPCTCLYMCVFLGVCVSKSSSVVTRRSRYAVGLLAVCMSVYTNSYVSNAGLLFTIYFPKQIHDECTGIVSECKFPNPEVKINGLPRYQSFSCGIFIEPQIARVCILCKSYTMLHCNSHMTTLKGTSQLMSRY